MYNNQVRKKTMGNEELILNFQCVENQNWFRDKHSSMEFQGRVGLRFGQQAFEFYLNDKKATVCGLSYELNIY